MVHERNARSLVEAVEPYVGLPFCELPGVLQDRLQMVKTAWDPAAQDDGMREKRLELAGHAARNELPPATPSNNWCSWSSSDFGPEGEFELAFEYANLFAKLEHDTRDCARLLMDVLRQKVPATNSHLNPPAPPPTLSPTLELGGRQFPIQSSLPREVMALPNAATLLLDVLRPRSVSTAQQVPPVPENAFDAALAVVTVEASSAATEPAGARNKWTKELMEEVGAYRSKHGMAATAKKFGVSAQFIRKKLPRKKPTPRLHTGLWPSAT